MFKHTRFILPLLIVSLIIIILWRGMSLHPNQIPSPLVNKATPHFALPTLADEKKLTTEKDFLGHVTLVNVWATWCAACAEEHHTLVRLAQQEQVNFYGWNYKDDTAAAKKWLAEYGNPYRVVAVDHAGQAAIDWGVYGAPETFVVDQQGVIRYKHIGPIDADVWQKTLKPLLKQLHSEKNTGLTSSLLAPTTLDTADKPRYDGRREGEKNSFTRDDNEEKRLLALTTQLRCLVCQNQNLAESNAPLAIDLREQIYRAIQEGQSDQQIIDYLVARYGNFILYRPLFNTATAGLWLAPALFLLGGVFYLLYYIRKKSRGKSCTD